MDIETKLYVTKNFDIVLVAIHKSKVILTLSKPVYVRMSILDFRITLMYEFHCGYFKNRYSKNARLLLTDTDSLMYQIKS